ncbi:hypothetical protein BC834DRAFT_840649 [Gloeopeniophorella convolvens]|nr:hypothetical protein BC834DRAFT_840649 [Gloeopeniophorella convolvens]
MLASTIVISLLATLSFASPVARQSSAPACAWNSVTDASNFTLLSVQKSDTSIQKQLVLGTNGQPNGLTAFLGTAESVTAPIVAENFVMANGGITGYGADDRVTAVSLAVADENGWLSFARPSPLLTPAPADAYCELFNTSPHGTEFPYTLAANGESEEFSLCQSSTSDEFVIIFNAVQASSPSAGYIWSSCQSVTVYMIFADQQ